MKREFKCVDCGVVVTGRLWKGHVVADNGPPDPTQTEPDSALCMSCAETLDPDYDPDPYEGSYREAADNYGARVAAESHYND